jgi:hypothetical protein
MGQTLKEIIRDEYKKCLTDPVYFMKKYCQIQHPQKGKIPFRLYPFQEDTLRKLRDNEYNIILKSRQLGISTLTAGYSLWLMTFFADKNILVIATKQEVAKNLVLKVKVMYEYLPSWLKLPAEEDNKLSLRLNNGSQIKATSSSSDSGRSEALSLLIMDETAFISNAEDIWISAQQTLATGGGAILLSTPNGTGNFFHKVWVASEDKTNRFNRIKLDWKVHPDRSQDWRDKQDELLGEKGAAQECIEGNAVVTIRDTETNTIQEVTLEELYRHLNNNKNEILTPYGFEKFAGVQKLNKNEYLNIVFEDFTSIKCSLTHKFISNNSEIFAKDLNVGDVIDSKSDAYKICFIEYVSKDIELYDIINVGDKNLFYVNNLVSHNCDADFITSGHTVIDSSILQWCSQTTVKEPYETRYIDANLWVWEPADYSKNYIVVADVARGDGADYSAFHVIDVESVTQVAEYKGQINTKDYGNLLVSVATEYNDALLVIENANVGWATIQVAIDRGYKNLYYSPKEGQVTDVSQQLSRYVDLKDASQMVPGFTTSSKTRPLVISKLDTYMRERVPVIRSRRLLDELFVFIWNGSRPEAQNGYHDDLVMSFCIALWIRDTALKLRQQGIELNRKTLDHFGKGVGAYNSSFTNLKDTGWSMEIGTNKESENISWLL